MKKSNLMKSIEAQKETKTVESLSRKMKTLTRLRHMETRTNVCICAKSVRNTHIQEVKKKDKINGNASRKV